MRGAFLEPRINKVYLKAYWEEQHNQSIERREK